MTTDTDRLDLRTRLGRYTGQEVIDIEMRRAKGMGLSQYAVSVMVGTINADRAFCAIDEQTYMDSFKRLQEARSGGMQ